MSYFIVVTYIAEYRRFDEYVRFREFDEVFPFCRNLNLQSQSHV